MIKIFYLIVYSTAFIFSSTLHGQGQLYNKGIFSIQSATDVILLSDFVNENGGNIRNDGYLTLKGNFENNGNFTFNNSLDNSYVIFKNNDTQELIFNTDVNIQNVIFDNDASNFAFKMSGRLFIFSSADFVKGIIKSISNSGEVHFKENADHTSVSDDSFVEGVCIKYGDDEFTYPIGANSHFREAIASSNLDINSVFSAQYFFENSNFYYPHGNKESSIEYIDNTEYWEVNQLTEESQIILTLSWNAFTTPSELIPQTNEELHIVRWDEEKNKWVDEGGVIDFSTQTVSTPVHLTKYGIFTLAKAKVNDKIIVYTAISPDGNGQNDYLIIEGLENYPNNKLMIFNRWGREIFNTESYDTYGNVFKGYANKGETTNKLLPSGVYYYILEYESNNNSNSSKREKKVGYLYLNAE